MIFLFFEEKGHKYFNTCIYETEEIGARTFSQSSNMSTNQCIYIHSCGIIIFLDDYAVYFMMASYLSYFFLWRLQYV